ncbi:Uncharacterised protein [Bordetella pertussis]|nr:Uncharacterised protein [Bordetella pertussis]
MGRLGLAGDFQLVRGGLGRGFGFRVGFGSRYRRRRRGRRRLSAFQRQLAQHGANALEHGIFGLFGGPVGVQLAFEHVFRFQENVHHVGAQSHLAAPDRVQQVFKQMRGSGQLLEAAESGRAALDGMRGAENRVELLDVGRAHIQLEQQLLHLREQLVGFVEECFVELTEVQT